MSVIVKGMEMPTSCRECIDRRLGFRAYFGCIKGTVAPSSEERLPDCPLRLLLEKHGRLIEAESLQETLDFYIREAGWGDVVNEVLRWVKDDFIPSERTIVEAEGEEEGSRE